MTSHEQTTRHLKELMARCDALKESIQTTLEHLKQDLKVQENQTDPETVDDLRTGH